MRILHKIFLTVFLTAGITLIVMAILFQWSLGRGFLAYINDGHKEHVTELADTLAEQYVANGENWDWIQRARVWRELTTTNPRPDRRGKRDEQRHLRDRPDGKGPPRPGGRGRERDRPQPPPGPKGPRNTFEPGPRLSLYDHNYLHIRGATKRFNSNHFSQAIEVDDTTVGWITLAPLRNVGATRDLNFLRQQSSEFFAIALVTLLSAALLAIFLSRHMTRPLDNLAGGIAKLVAGDYNSRVNASGRDEIASLSDDVDHLAYTLEDNRVARQRWMADVSHELRTPLAILKSELEAVHDGVRPFEAATIDSLMTEVARLNKLVDDLHQLSLSDAGALTYEMKTVDIGDVVQSAAEPVLKLFDQKQLTVSIETETDEDLNIRGDAQRLTQLITNLLQNSLHYTDAGGAVQIKLDRHDRHARLVVADTAPSVDTDACERLFDRLYRVEQSRNRRKGGSGLGLSICKSIVDAHNGEIVAAPSEIGGLQISIQFPLTNS